jgi:cellulose synthase/poly-beta-1,6-N-acetylglucosamine synthase-like glycosyltransferase
VSFIVPCYNDGATVGKTIQSIYSSYNKRFVELIVIDDCSTDDSVAVLRQLQKQYRFTLSCHSKNLGKARTLNVASRKATADILFFVDADTMLNREAVRDVLARIDGSVAAASAPYVPADSGFLARMQEVEYTMLMLLQGANNRYSTISLWGGCFAVRHSAFVHVNRFSESAIIEDMDLALKLNGAGYRVEQSFCTVKTHVPTTLRSWFAQKIRWSSGGAQNFVRYFRVWIRKPLYLVFVVIFSVLSLFFLKSFITQALFVDNVVDNYEIALKGTLSLVTLRTATFSYGLILLKNFLTSAYFIVFSVPYVVPMSWPLRRLGRALYVIPYALLYYPAYAVLSIIGIGVAASRYRSLKRGERPW